MTFPTQTPPPASPRMLSPKHAIAIQIRRLPRQRRKIQRTRHAPRQSPLLPKRPETRPHRDLHRPPRRIPGRLRGTPRRPPDPLSTHRRRRTGPGPHPRPHPLASPPHPHPRTQRVRQRDNSLRRTNRRGILRNRRPRPPRLRFQSTGRQEPGPLAPNPLRSLANPLPRPHLQAPAKITKRTQAPGHPAKSRCPKSHSANSRSPKSHTAQRSSPMRQRGGSTGVYFSSDLNTSIAFSICRSCPVRKSAGVLSTTTSGGTP
jgi:hypothetical protein